MRIAKLTVAASAALLLTACGGSPLDGKTGPEVADAAADALEKAGAVHVAGTVEEGGEAGDLEPHLQGEDAVGTTHSGRVDIEPVAIGGTVYMQAPGEFWASFGMPEEMTGMFDGQWVMVPEEGASQFADFSLAGFVDELRNPESTIEEDVESGERDGKDVVV